MPLHAYACDSCGVTIEQYRTIAEGGCARLPDCPECGTRMYWCVPVVAMDAKEPGSSRSIVHRLVPTRHGPVQVREEVNTLHRLRQIERDSEQRYRDGEGEPLRFRAYANNGSNMDVNSFGAEGQIGERHYDSGHQPVAKPNIGVKRHGQEKPEIPIARGGGVTALK